MCKDDYRNLFRFNGKDTDDYNLCRIRAVTALKRGKLWPNLVKDNCGQEVKDEAPSMFVAALGDSAFRVCSLQVEDPMKILELLDARYATYRSSCPTSIFTTMFSKRY